MAVAGGTRGGDISGKVGGGNRGGDIGGEDGGEVGGTGGGDVGVGPLGGGRGIAMPASSKCAGGPPPLVKALVLPIDKSAVLDSSAPRLGLSLKKG